MSDDIREKFYKLYEGSPELLQDFPFYVAEGWWGFQEGYQAGQADAAALVAELVDTLASLKCDMYDSKPLDSEVCDEVEQSLTKAQAWMEGK